MKDTLQDAAERIDSGHGDVDDAERLNRPQPHTPSRSKSRGPHGIREDFTDLPDEPKLAVVSGGNMQLQLYALAYQSMYAGVPIPTTDVERLDHHAPFLVDASDFPRILPESSNPRWKDCPGALPMETSMNPDVASVVAAAAEAVKRPDIPNRVCAYEGSEYFWPCKIPGASLAVRFNGLERRGDVVEFDVAEGWIRIHVRGARGKFKQERGQWVTITLKGTVEPFWKE